MPACFVIAAARAPEQLPGDLLPWLLVLLGVIVLGGVVIYFLRRWLASDTSASAAGFTLQDLRELHARGELTDEQFQAARTAMIGRMKQPGAETAANARPARDTDSGADC